MAAMASAASMLILIACTPLSAGLSDFARGFAEGLPAPIARLVAFVGFVVLVVLLWELASLPAVIYLAIRVDRAYGRSVPSFETVLAGQAQATAIAVPAALIAGGTVLAAANLIGGWWWWTVAGPLLAIALAGALRLTPLALALVAGIGPLKRPDLQARLAEMARRVRVPVTRIDEWMIQTGPMALVTGAGPTRRVLLSSEMARNWTDDEILVVVAHELGHDVHGDLWRSLALDAVILWTGLLAADIVVSHVAGMLRVTGPADLAALPAIALVAGAIWAAATPLRHAQSRRHERRADAFALGLTGAVDAFDSAIRRLSISSLAEERPSLLTLWLYHRHPSVGERLALADSYRAGKL